jgi:hypothetical protein
MDIKSEFKKKHGIDLDVVKPFGPRNEESKFTEGTNQVVNGRDKLLEDQYLMRFAIARYFDIDMIVNDLKLHFEWR